MKIIPIILLLILSQQLIDCLSANKTLRNPCIISSECKTPGTHCNRELGVCECDIEYPIPVPKTGFCLDFRRLGEECLTDDQCTQIENGFCFGGKQIDLIPANYIWDHPINVSNLWYTTTRSNPKERTPNGCRCKPGYRHVKDKCFKISFNYNDYKCIDCTLVVSIFIITLINQFLIECLSNSTDIPAMMTSAVVILAFISI